ncbi:MAG: radical SAM protein [Bacteroidota bacterium]
MTEKLNINEIFFSIQGEGTRAGLPCIFIRMQGCMLRCHWCDTDYALELNINKNIMSIDEILEKIKEYKCKFVELTGGEPLAQDNTYILAKYLCDLGYQVAIETNGYADVSKLDSRVIKIMDMKCPGSGMSKFNNYSNFNYLDKKDEVKFVISDENDFLWAKDIIIKYNLLERVGAVLVSPAFGLIEPRKLAELILSSSLNIRLQLQIHKYIWEPNTRGV